jgi:hypothetical protein
MTPAKVRLAAAAMGKKGTVVDDLSGELRITRHTIYRYISSLPGGYAGMGRRRLECE